MDKILIVDDEPGIRVVVSGVLQSAGYEAEAVDSAEMALERLGQSHFDLLLVDLQMAGMDGLTLIEQVRTRQMDLAIIILTGFATVDSAIKAVREGVDDFLVKPASPEAIRNSVRRALDRRRANQEKSAALSRIARELQTLLPETPAPPPTALVRRGPLVLDEASHRVEWQGQPLSLTPTEFKLLAHLARNLGQVISPQSLVAVTQGYECSPAEARELVKPHLYSLRAKLETDPANPRYLVNVRGIGYSLRLEA